MLNDVLFGFLILSTSIWIGGMTTVVLAATSSARQLSADARVAFFRDFGRKYVVTATPALVIAYVCGGILLAGEPWTTLSTALVVCAALLLVALAIGIAQARRMTRLRHSSTSKPDDAGLAARIARSARLAGTLRAGLGVLTLVLFVLAVVRWA
ncbi:hypothetical protein [Spelaeicoccus albus]|uniref:DUF1772 domain-containing protein n=1 Tax=Spelaeicoccus albus TaxID=1280376 RepID=A0A7Z0D3J2_9MICO|nr:hypothetical protein [Spelaeicoccus albus]NYI68220.1 hypothetical protein [Spelaeicoccus albus]